MDKTDSEFRLALHGGSPAIAAGPPAWPGPDEAVRAALESAWADGSWGQYDGPHGRRLAQRLAEMHGVQQAWCCSSGTVAVELALRGLRVSDGDEVILAGYDFPGNFRAVEAVGAVPVLVDIQRRTWCLDAAQLDIAWSPRVQAVLVSHLHGGLAAMPEIRAWADVRGAAVVEDACQVPGGQIAGRPAGAWGDVGVLSFGGSKLLSAGRGGALLTDRADVVQRIKIYSERGNQAHPLSELQAAVLLPQLESLAERNQRRLQNAMRLLDLCRGFSILEPITWDAVRDAPSFYKVGWLFGAQTNVIRRDEFLTAVRAEGVALDEGFRGFALRSGRRCRKAGDLPNSQEAAQRTVLLHHPILLSSPAEVDRIAGAIGKVLNALTP
jgi:dTDP-4-amino-4,6-dideoxygalactose transaminase